MTSFSLQSSAYEDWSTRHKSVPYSINEQLAGTFPTVVLDAENGSYKQKGKKVIAFFIRAQSEEELSFFSSEKGGMVCNIRPKIVQSPYGPIIIVYGQIRRRSHSSEVKPFLSETAIFPHVASTPLHKEIADLLSSDSAVYYVVCDASGTCLFNARISILKAWRKDFEKRLEAIKVTKKITDEKEAISSLYWYQGKYALTPEIFAS